ncbi:TPA: helix-turn-helix domain-containing protein [Morganella morganii]
MSRCHLARMMGEQKKRIADVARETTQKVDLVTIEKLCLLFDCSIGDLLKLQASNSPA